MADATDTARKTCFVAMPVTTPVSYTDDLRDPDHFSHVLEHLFTPALEQAGYTVIPPKMLGAALIHAEIIKHLEQADLVLADLSNHNANVFFELGLRTSLDRPVVLVKDKRTTTIPFDLGTINVLDYDESLATWTLGEEVRRLAEHVSQVPVGEASGNAMWQYFGLTKSGGPAEAGSLEAKVNLLVAEVTKLRLAPAVPQISSETMRRFKHELDRILLDDYGLDFLIIPNGSTGRYDIQVSSPIPPSVEDEIKLRALALNVPIGEIGPSWQMGDPRI